MPQKALSFIRTMSVMLLRTACFGAALLADTACADDLTRISKEPAPSAGIMVGSCAPWDGAAIEIRVAAHQRLECGEKGLSTPQGPYYIINVYQSWAHIQEKAPISLDLDQERGHLLSCPGGDRPCVTIAGAKLELNKDGGTLTLPMTVMKAMKIPLHFSVQQCKQPTYFCG